MRAWWLPLNPAGTVTEMLTAPAAFAMPLPRNIGSDAT